MEGNALEWYHYISNRPIQQLARFLGQGGATTILSISIWGC